MHEVGLAESIVEIVEKTVRDNGGTKATSVTLSIGELANVEMQSLKQALSVATLDTPMEGAEIRYSFPQGQAWCMACCKTVTVHHIGDACPECGGHQLAVTGGTEMRVSELEIAD